MSAARLGSFDVLHFCNDKQDHLDFFFSFASLLPPDCIDVKCATFFLSEHSNNESVRQQVYAYFHSKDGAFIAVVGVGK